MQTKSKQSSENIQENTEVLQLLTNSFDFDRYTVTKNSENLFIRHSSLQFCMRIVFLKSSFS